ncbi:MAG: sugar ABC transporter permease [Spirochaetaceae bacterium]|nr:sugar ABC transporter permease [Spirochaetaceae bacterium]
MMTITKDQLSLSKETRKKMVPYLLIAPVIIYYFIFWLFPVLKAIIESFRDVDGIWTFGNYIHIFKDPMFYSALSNTAFLVIFSVTIEFILAFGLALLINTKFKGSSLFLFLAMIPMALPAVAVGAMWSSGLATRGWLNSFLMHAGIINDAGKILFLAGGKMATLWLIIIIDAWTVIPFVMIILLAGLQGVGADVREAGAVFGGTKFQVLRKITIPMLKPTITTAMILRIISAIQIWLIIVMLFGFNRLPTLLEQVVLDYDQLGAEYFERIGLALSVIVAIIVSIVAVLYLKVSGSFERGEQKDE